MLIIRGVNLFPSQIEELILKTPKLSPHYQLEVDRKGHMDDLTVHVELKPEYATALEEVRKAAGCELQHHIKALIGINTKIEVMDVGGVARSAGKAKRIVDLRKS
jgi:phenylacetate-CoA ligase